MRNIAMKYDSRSWSFGVGASLGRIHLLPVDSPKRTAHAKPHELALLVPFGMPAVAASLTPNTRE